MPAKPKAVPNPDKVLANYNPVHLMCRVDRHRWGRKTFYFVRDVAFTERHKVCEDCGSKRITLVHARTLYPVDGSSTYRYAPGYRTPGTGLRLADFRERAFAEDFEAAAKDGRVEYSEDALPKGKNKAG